MGKNCATLLADLILYLYEAATGASQKKTKRRKPDL